MRNKELIQLVESVVPGTVAKWSDPIDSTTSCVVNFNNNAGEILLKRATEDQMIGNFADEIMVVLSDHGFGVSFDSGLRLKVIDIRNMFEPA